jgi:hypothetical protein
MGETKVGEPKNGGTDSLAAKRQPARPTPPDETEQLVLTVSVSKGEILMVEKMEKSGQRHEISAEEFAAMAGEDEVEDFEAALEEAYKAGILDALGEEDEEEDEEEEHAENALRELILGRAAGRLLLRQGVRRLILRRALRRRLLGRPTRAAAKAERRGRKN